MDKAKYIVVEDGFGTQSAIVFPCTIQHAKLAQAFRKVISAGFVQFTYDDDGNTVNPHTKAHCYGKSTSLCLESNQEADSDLITRYILNPKDY